MTHAKTSTTETHKSKHRSPTKSHKRTREVARPVSRISSRKARKETKLEDATFVYECTRIGCCYRIVRDERAEQGQLRFDLKCPKCHHKEFRCLGKGDLPETFNIPIPATTINFEAFKTIGLGSN
jgi:hypothetical protein